MRCETGRIDFRGERNGFLELPRNAPAEKGLKTLQLNDKQSWSFVERELLRRLDQRRRWQPHVAAASLASVLHNFTSAKSLDCKEHTVHHRFANFDVEHRQRFESVGDMSASTASNATPECPSQDAFHLGNTFNLGSRFFDLGNPVLRPNRREPLALHALEHSEEHLGSVALVSVSD